MASLEASKAVIMGINVRVTRYVLQVASCELRVTGCELRVAGCGLRGKNKTNPNPPKDRRASSQKNISVICLPSEARRAKGGLLPFDPDGQKGTIQFYPAISATSQAPQTTAFS